MTNNFKIQHFRKVSITLFIISLLLEVDNVRGWHLLVFGFLGIFKGSGICFLWLANPALLISWILISKRDISLRFSLVATILSVSFFALEELFDIMKIKTYGLGYIIWLSSSIIMLCGNFIVKRNETIN